MNWNRDKELIWHPFTSAQHLPVLPVKSAKDSVLILDDGKHIIDAISSWWVINHGHGNLRIVEAIQKQVAELEQVIFAGFTHRPALELAEAMDERLGTGKYHFFFSDNGSTAVEVALKIAIQHHYNMGRKRSRIVALEGAYHGDTVGAMSASARSVFSRPFDPLLADVTHLPLPGSSHKREWIVQLESEIGKGDVAAFIFEPGIQGAGGMRFFDLQLLNQVREFCRKAEVAFIADEVMTGFGRTGELFPSLCMQPDLMCFSKGLTGGFLPMGLTAVQKHWRESFNSKDDRRKAFFHGHSFTGNPIACAAAAASLREFETYDWQQHIGRMQSQHQAFLNSLESHPQIKNTRVRGSILAFEIENEQTSGYLNPIGPRIYEYCLQKGALVRPLGSTVYLMPPFCTTEDQLQQLYAILKTGLENDWNL